MVIYKDGKAHQYLGDIDFYSLADGDFNAAIKYLKQQKEEYGEHLRKAMWLYDSYADSTDYYFGTRFSYGNSKKLVKFDSLVIKYEMDREGEKETLQVWGIRDILPEEAKALDEERVLREKQSKNARQAEFKRLKKEFEGDKKC